MPIHLSTWTFSISTDRPIRVGGKWLVGEEVYISCNFSFPASCRYYSYLQLLNCIPVASFHTTLIARILIVSYILYIKRLYSKLLLVLGSIYFIVCFTTTSIFTDKRMKRKGLDGTVFVYFSLFPYIAINCNNSPRSTVANGIITPTRRAVLH